MFTKKEGYLPAEIEIVLMQNIDIITSSSTETDNSGSDSWGWT